MTTPPSVTKTIPGQIDLIEEVIASFPGKGKILDIGTGSGLAARRFHEEGWQVAATGFDMEAYLDDQPLPEGIRVLQDVDICDAHEFQDAEFDAIWCAHVLEHVSDTGRALDELRRILKPDGWLFMAVPPYKDRVVGGHVNCGWNLGTLMYVLADAGFDLAEGRFVHHGYNVFGMVRRGPGRLPAGELRRTNGDIEALAGAGRFPKGFKPRQGFQGRLHAVNWRWNRPPRQIPVPRTELAAPPAIAPMTIGFFLPWLTREQDDAGDLGPMLANAMAARGHEVTVFTLENGRDPSRWSLADDIALVALEDADDQPAQDRMAVEVASRNIDLLVDPQMTRASLRNLRCAHKLGLPLVLSQQDDPRLSEWLDRFTPDERDLAMAGATLIHLPLESLIAPLDPSLRGKTRVIPNPIREPDAPVLHARCEGDTRTLLAVSRLVPRKNPSRVIEAFARLAGDFPQWRLQVVGQGPLHPLLQTQAGQLGVADRVGFADAREDVSRFYAIADLFVIPSLFETFPQRLCEAMAHGLPAVGIGACDAVQALIAEGETGLLCRDDSPQELAAALRELMTDDEARHRMGAAARRRFLSRFSSDTVHAAWEEMLAEAKDLYRPARRPDHATVMAVRLWEHVWGPIQGGAPVAT